MQTQHGVALVLALLVVALVTVIAVELSWRFELTLVRSANRWYGVQSSAYLHGAEQLAAYALKMDAEQDQESGELKDTLNDVWAMPVETPMEDGWLRGRVEDAQGRFNLNSLVVKAKPPKNNAKDWQNWTAPQRRFIRLLQTIELEEEVFLDRSTAENITQAVIDWIDDDSDETGFGGAESDYYGQLEVPFFIANKPMSSVSELFIVRGMTPQFYQKLLPLVIALPKEVALNVNTMPIELMRTITSKENMYPNNLEDAQDIFTDRTGGFVDMEEFKSSAVVEGVVGKGANGGGGASMLDTDGLTVSSEYFILFADSSVGDHVKERRTMLYRKGSDVSVLRRTDANF